MSNLIWAIPMLILATLILAALAWLYRDMRDDLRARPISGWFGLMAMAAVIVAGVVYPYLDKVQ